MVIMTKNKIYYKGDFKGLRNLLNEMGSENNTQTINIEKPKKQTIKQKIINDFINQVEEQEKKGKKEYGIIIDDCNFDAYNWKNEAINEMIDALYYKHKEIQRLEHIINLQSQEIHKLKDILKFNNAARN